MHQKLKKKNKQINKDIPFVVEHNENINCLIHFYNVT